MSWTCCKLGVGYRYNLPTESLQVTCCRFVVDLLSWVQWCGNAVERRSGKYFGAGTALRQTSLATGGTLTLKRSGKSRRIVRFIGADSTGATGNFAPVLKQEPGQTLHFAPVPFMEPVL